MNDIAEQKTFSEWLKQLDDPSNEYSNVAFVKNVKLWLEKQHISEDSVVGWSINVDTMDITDKRDGLWKKKIAGPYNRIKIVYDNSSTIYGCWLNHSNGTIEDDIEENWNILWIKQKYPQYTIAICKICKNIKYSQLVGLNEDEQKEYNPIAETIRIFPKCNCPDRLEWEWITA